MTAYLFLFLLWMLLITHRSTDTNSCNSLGLLAQCHQSPIIPVSNQCECRLSQARLNNVTQIHQNTSCPVCSVFFFLQPQICFTHGKVGIVKPQTTGDKKYSGWNCNSTINPNVKVNTQKKGKHKKWLASVFLDELVSKQRCSLRILKAAKKISSFSLN